MLNMQVRLFLLALIAARYVSATIILPTTVTPPTGIDTADVSASVPTAAALRGRVKVDVYYETLCPDSMRFLLTRLIPDYTAIKDLIDLRLYPFGKAEIVEYDHGFDFYCQHGSKECRGNMFQACAIDEAKSNWDQVLPFIECMETRFTSRNPNIDSITKECADERNFSYKDLLACASGARGNRLMYEAGVKTKAIRPRLTFVPTIILNEVYSEDTKWAATSTNFTKLICGTYTRDERPGRCPNF